MKRYHCECGQEVFFDNRHCGSCGRSLGFNVNTLNLEVVIPVSEIAVRTTDGRIFNRCGNWIEHDACNWLVDQNRNIKYLCYACNFNRIIPNQTKTSDEIPANFFRWLKLEDAKKRLVFTLRTLGLNINDGWSDAKSGLLFDFLEEFEAPENAEVVPVMTGYFDGVITINSKEADDVALATARSQLNERQRTVLGHFRHESGHYFWDKIFSKYPLSEYFEETFGSTELSYRQSLDKYYKNGPPRNWHDGYISAYATSHPSEDWAETWSHYLLIYECLETAHGLGMIPHSPIFLDMFEALRIWRPMAVKLNQLNRSIGLHDAYPFVITSRIEQKLQYVDALVRSMRKQSQSDLQHDRQYCK